MANFAKNHEAKMAQEKLEGQNLKNFKMEDFDEDADQDQGFM